MIDNISYEEMINYSQELKNNSDIIKLLIKDKNLPELEEFTTSIENYSKYLNSLVEMHKQADDVLSYLDSDKRTS